MVNLPPLPKLDAASAGGLNAVALAFAAAAVVVIVAVAAEVLHFARVLRVAPLCVGAGAAVFGLLPLALGLLGTGWEPGDRPRAG